MTGAYQRCDAVACQRRVTPAADANEHASRAGLARASRADQPEARAEVLHSVLDSGFPPGLVNFSDLASFHDGSAEACLA